jgi:hypothetical protein
LSYVPFGAGIALIIFSFFVFARRYYFRSAVDECGIDEGEPLDCVYERLKKTWPDVPDKLTASILTESRKDFSRLLSRSAGIPEELGMAKTPREFSDLNFPHEAEALRGRTARSVIDAVSAIDKTLSSGEAMSAPDWSKIWDIVVFGIPKNI